MAKKSEPLKAEFGPESPAELRQRIRELTAAVAARDNFIAVAAHELRNPMTPVIGHIDLLMAAVKGGRCSTDQVQRGLERVQHAVRRYIRRADVLLQVSHINSEKFHLEFEPLDLAAVLRELTDDFVVEAQRAGVLLTLTVADALTGTWNRMAMEQIVDNLVSNAFKYGGRTPVELTATLHEEQVRIQVRDHGDGISPANRERVFGQFERINNLSSQRSGFGIGLWVVRRLVEAMGGAIAVDDAPGGGALFTVTLPRNVKGDRA